ncbi:MAG: hypothetical protein H0S79_16060, partial [Anaerolineaceae bacterium]|nr:hypothetical protein [Anaerolineaceae bacterium]
MANENEKDNDLIDSKLCAWDEKDVPLHERGVSLDWLIGYVKSVYDSHNEPKRKEYTRKIQQYEQYENQKKAANWFSHVPEPEYQPYPKEPELFEITTRQFVSDYVIPQTEAIKAPLYARVPQSKRGKPSTFISHVWDAKIRSVVQISGVQKPNSPGTLDTISGKFIWIDFVCYNQHKLNNDKIAIDMENLIKSIGKVLFALTPVPFTNRIWCLWELLSVAKSNSEVQFGTPTRMHFTDYKMWINEYFDSRTSVRDAKSTNPSDYEIICKAINEHFGS